MVNHINTLSAQQSKQTLLPNTTCKAGPPPLDGIHWLLIYEMFQNYTVIMYKMHCNELAQAHEVSCAVWVWDKNKPIWINQPFRWRWDYFVSMVFQCSSDSAFLCVPAPTNWSPALLLHNSALISSQNRLQQTKHSPQLSQQLLVFICSTVQ